MSDQPPPENPSGQPTPPENPYGQPAGSPTPYGQPAGSPNPYGQPAPPQNPYGQPVAPQDAHGRPIESQEPYGQPGQAPAGYPYAPPRTGDARPATVTAAGWITIVLSSLSALLFAFASLMFFVARDQVINELERQPELRDLDVDIDSIVGALVATMLVLTVWSLVSVALGILVLRRSNVARILLVISSVGLSLFALLSILSGISVVWLVATLLVIVLLFVGGAGDWFARRGSADPYATAGHIPPPPGY